MPNEFKVKNGVITPNETITDSTASTNSTTGALKVTGGAGIGGNLNVGGNVGVTGKITVSQTPTAATDAANKSYVDGLIPSTTKGDLIVHNGTNNIRLPVGGSGTFLGVDSTTASGLVWKTPTSADFSNFVAVINTTSSHTAAQTGTVTYTLTAANEHNHIINYGMVGKKFRVSLYPTATTNGDPRSYLIGTVTNVTETTIVLSVESNNDLSSAESSTRWIFSSIDYTFLTSSTSISLAVASRTFTYASSPNLNWKIGDTLSIYRATTKTNRAEGVITAVSSTSVTVNIYFSTGTGTFTNWVLAPIATPKTINKEFVKIFHIDLNSTTKNNIGHYDLIMAGSLFGNTHSKLIPVIVLEDRLLLSLRFSKFDTVNSTYTMGVFTSDAYGRPVYAIATASLTTNTTGDKILSLSPSIPIYKNKVYYLGLFSSVDTQVGYASTYGTEPYRVFFRYGTSAAFDVRCGGLFTSMNSEYINHGGSVWLGNSSDYIWALSGDSLIL